jgi:hypothetical protein
MKRFLVLAVAGALGVAGGTGLAFGQTVHPQTPTKPQATKVSPAPAPGKHPPSAPQTQANKPAPPVQRPADRGNKSTSGRSVEKGVPKPGQPSPAHKGPAQPGKGSKPGAGSYSWDDYRRDLDKANQEQRDGTLEELPADLEIVGGAVAGEGLGGLGAAIKNAPTLIDAKSKELKGVWDGLSATGKFIGARANDAQKSSQGPAKPKNGAQKPQGPAKPKSGTGR